MSHDSIPVCVLSPSIDFYKAQLSRFKGLEKLNENVKDGDSIVKIVNSILYSDLIDKDNITPAPNNSSVVSLFDMDNSDQLFLGDAGVEAILEALKFYRSINYKDLSNISFLNVPHHGSIKNLNTSLIKQLSPFVSFISAAGNQNHPSKLIVKALTDNGSLVYCTSHSGNTIWSPDRNQGVGLTVAESISEFVSNDEDDFQQFILKSVFSRR